jgi:uncharacterized protein YrrD
MELKEGTSVYAPNGDEVGKINRFVMDPMTNEVTHVVIQKGWLLPEDKVLPMDMIRRATDERVERISGAGDFDQWPPFEEQHFIGWGEREKGATGYPPEQYVPSYIWYPPYGVTGYPAYGVGQFGWPPSETTQNIPSDTVALKEGVDVVSSDDEEVGDIERVIVDPQTNRATHFLISEGMLFKERKVIPMSWVSTVEEDKVCLAVPADLLERVPAYEE